MAGIDTRKATPMGSDPSDRMPPWLTAAFDQQDAAIQEVRHNNRARFEKMVRGGAPGEHKVREAMAWFDAQRAHYNAAVDIHAAGPESMSAPQSEPPRQRRTEPVPVPDIDDAMFADEQPSQRRETTHVHRTRFEVETPADPPAPGKSTRLLQSPAVYGKSFAVGAVIGGALWLAVTGLLVWLFDSAWWGWWPGLLTVPVAAAAFLAWWVTAQRDIKHWIVYGGREPLRSRPRFK
ncbi:hypothetical protein BAY61_31715 (plasmid) [Prauserella marina]|nr:hypothetical protein BAY61_31715 [Prauserella marina]